MDKPALTTYYYMACGCLVIILCCGSIIGGIGYGIYAVTQTEPTLEESDEIATEEMATEQIPQTDEIEPLPEVISGNGDDTTELFEFNSDYYLIEIRYLNSSGTNSVELRDDINNTVELISANLDDKESRIIYLPNKLNKLSIKSDSSWQVKITPAEEAEVATDELNSLSGDNAQGVANFNISSASQKITIEYTGEGNFSATLYDPDSNEELILANELGTFTKTYNYSLDPGNYHLDIDTSGNWQFTLD